MCVQTRDPDQEQRADMQGLADFESPCGPYAYAAPGRSLHPPQKPSEFKPRNFRKSVKCSVHVLCPAGDREGPSYRIRRRIKK